MKIRVINYKQNTPTVYNKGTVHESTQDIFMAHFFCGTLEKAQKYADMLNQEKPEYLMNGELAHCDERFYYAEEATI